MRSLAVAFLLSHTACASMEPAPQAAGMAAVVADAGSVPAPAPAEPNSPPNSTVEVAAKAEPRQVCWTETVTGTRSRKQKVCRTEASDRSGRQARDDLKRMQDHGGAAAGPPASMGGG